MMKKNILNLAFVAAAALILSGCASKMQAPQNSGFFDSYEELEKNSNFAADKNALLKHEKVYVEDVLVISNIDEKEQTDEQKNSTKRSQNMHLQD